MEVFTTKTNKNYPRYKEEEKFKNAGSFAFENQYSWLPELQPEIPVMLYFNALYKE